MKLYTISSFNLIHKERKEILTLGMNCKKYPTYETDIQEKEYLQNRIDLLLEKYKDDLHPDTGYIFLKQSKEDLLFYHNFESLLTLVTVKAKNLRSFHTDFLVLSRNIDIVAEEKTDLIDIAKTVADFFLSDDQTYDCNLCSQSVCIPMVSRDHLKKQFNIIGQN